MSSPEKLWNKNFLLWFLGSAQSAFGTALAGIATSFLILHQTGSAGAMGINLALTLLPGLLEPFLGALVDRWPLKPPLFLGNVLRGLLQLSIGLLALKGHVSTELIYIASFLTGLIGAFYTPATQGMMTRLVPPEQIEKATGAIQSATQAMNMLGYIGGGILIALIGRANSILLDGLSFLLFALLLLPIKFPEREKSVTEESYWASFRSGLNYVRSSSVLLALPFLALLLNAALAPIEMLLPKQMLVLGAGEKGFGIFFGLMLAGTASGSLFAPLLTRKVSPELISVLGIAGLGTALMTLALSNALWQFYFVALVMGLAEAICNFGISIMFQKRVKPEYFGRVGSLLGAVSIIGMPLTLLALAPIVDHLNLKIIFAFAGAIGLISASIWFSILKVDKATTIQKQEKP